MVRVRYSFGSRHTGRIANIKKQRQKYPQIMKDVIEMSDIVLEILDARFIEETRNIEIEEMVDSLEKKLIFIFNKCDLVNKEKLEKEIPKWMKPYVFVSATKGIGLNDLKSRVKMEAKGILAQRKKNLKEGDSEGNWKRVHVGVIGVPNAGKSSVINFITRRGVAKTASKAGFTKGMQKIRMSEGILILDTPGVIPEAEYTTEKKGFAKDVKIGARSYSDVKDPERAVLFLVRAKTFEDPKNPTEDELFAIEEAKRSAEAISKYYDVKFVDENGNADVEVLIEKLGKKRGFLGKGGVVDEDRTCRLILRDWQEGKIRIR